MSDFAFMRPPVCVSMRRVNVGMRKINTAPELFHSYIRPKKVVPLLVLLSLFLGAWLLILSRWTKYLRKSFLLTVTGDILVLPFSSFYLAFIFKL